MPPQLLNLKLCPAISFFGIRMMIVVVIIVCHSCIVIIGVVMMQRWQLIWWQQTLWIMQIIVLHIVVVIVVVWIADMRQTVQHLQRHIVVDRWRWRLHRREYLKIVHLLVLH